MTFPTEWKNKIHVPNHEPDVYRARQFSRTDKKMVVVMIIITNNQNRVKTEEEEEEQQWPEQ